MHDLKTLWVWVTEEPNGDISQLGGYLPDTKTVASLSTRSREVADKWRPIAERHARGSGQKTWLREYQIVADEPPV